MSADNETIRSRKEVDIKTFEAFLTEISESELPRPKELKPDAAAIRRITKKTRLKLGFPAGERDEKPAEAYGCRGSRRIIRAAAVFVAIAAAFSSTIAAYQIVMNLSRREAELIDPTAETIGVEQQSGNVSFTIDKAARDGNDLFIYYTVKTGEQALEGDILTYDTLELGKTVDGEYETLSKYTGTALAGEALCRVTEASDEISSVLMYNLKTDVPGDYTLKLDGLRIFKSELLDKNGSNEKSISDYLSDGELILNFTVGEFDSIEKTILYPDAETTIDGMTVKLAVIQITPLTVEVKFVEENHDYSGYPLYWKLENIDGFFEDQARNSLCTYDLGFYREDGSVGYRADNYDPYKLWMGAAVEIKDCPDNEFTFKWYFREPFYPEELAELSRTVYSYPESGEILTETQVLWENK